MYASHFAILLLAAFAATPALSAPFSIDGAADIVARDATTLVDSMKRDGLVDDIEARGLFSTFINDVGDFGNGIVTAGEDVVGGIGQAIGAVGDGVDNALNNVPFNDGGDQA